MSSGFYFLFNSSFIEVTETYASLNIYMYKIFTYIVNIRAPPPFAHTTCAQLPTTLKRDIDWRVEGNLQDVPT